MPRHPEKWAGSTVRYLAGCSLHFCAPKPEPSPQQLHPPSLPAFLIVPPSLTLSVPPTPTPAPTAPDLEGGLSIVILHILVGPPIEEDPSTSLLRAMVGGRT